MEAGPRYTLIFPARLKDLAYHGLMQAKLKRKSCKSNDGTIDVMTCSTIN